MRYWKSCFIPVELLGLSAAIIAVYFIIEIFASVCSNKVFSTRSNDKKLLPRNSPPLYECHHKRISEKLKVCSSDYVRYESWRQASRKNCISITRHVFIAGPEILNSDETCRRLLLLVEKANFMVLCRYTSRSWLQKDRMHALSCVMWRPCLFGYFNSNAREV